MPPFVRLPKAASIAAALATCFAPCCLLAQGAFVPQGQSSQTIQLKQSSRASMGVDQLQPPLPTGALFSKKLKSISPADVDFEIIDDEGNRASTEPKIADDSTFANHPAAGNPPAIKRVKDDEEVGVAQNSNVNARNQTASTPIVTVEIDSAQEVNLDEETDIHFRLRNAGSKTVQEVAFVIDLPSHAKFISAKPSPTSKENGKLTYSVSDLASNQEREILVRIVPTEKVAMDFRTQMQVIDAHTTVVSVRQPKLVMKVKGPKQVNIGDETTHVVSIENVGDGLARKVRLQGNFPDELRFLKQQGMSSPKDLKPGENLIVTIQSLAKLPGQVKLDFTAEGDRVTANNVDTALKISQPELKVLAVGPNMNFVDRDGIYSIKVDNSGEVDVSDVLVSLAIPRGMTVTTINRKAKLDEVSQTLTWNFDNIKARSNETIQLKAVSTKAGEQVCRIVVASNETRKSEFMLKTSIASRADLSIDMANNSGPVQVGSKATFDVNVVNKGSQSAGDVEVTVELPPSLMAVAKDNMGVVVDEANNSIVFLSNQVEPGKKLSFTFTAIGVAKGEHIVRSALKASGSERRVIVEESVYVYETNESRVSENLTPVFPR